MSADLTAVDKRLAQWICGDDTGISSQTIGWNRLLWGVAFRGGQSERPTLIGAGWDAPVIREAYPGQPVRALLFTTRGAARAWCAAQHARYRGRTDCCGAWRFRAVRVRERVTRCPR